MHAHTHTHTHIYTHAHTHMHMHTCTHTHMHTTHAHTAGPRKQGCPPPPTPTHTPTPTHRRSTTRVLEPPSLPLLLRVNEGEEVRCVLLLLLQDRTRLRGSSRSRQAAGQQTS